MGRQGACAHVHAWQVAACHGRHVLVEGRHMQVRVVGERVGVMSSRDTKLQEKGV